MIGTIYITGDTHGEFYRIEYFCRENQTSKEDIMIVLGDAGVNSSYLERDKRIKDGLSKLPITILCIHGNHEKRPKDIPSYEEMVWNGGTVYVESKYPNILFAKDGEVYELAGKQVMAIGGAYSVDKYFRLARGWDWWENEQPDEGIKARVEKRLEEMDWKVDVVLSHTCPFAYRPIDTFMQTIDQSKVDTSTERWMEELEVRLQYEKWYCGHYHIERKIDKMIFMFKDIQEFRGDDTEWHF